MFSTSMDTKGREELLGMSSCQSYQGCPVCTHSWTPGALFSRKACVCDGYRRFLAAHSNARQAKFRYKGHVYEYRSNPKPLTLTLTTIVFYVFVNITSLAISNVEERAKPKTRDDAFVRAAVGLATKSQPFAGHKTAPLLARWPEFKWWRINVPEIMHGELINVCSD